jgi:hypothetical protein
MSKKQPKSGAAHNDATTPDGEYESIDASSSIQTPGETPITFSGLAELNAFVNKLLDQKTEALTKKIVDEVRISQGMQPLVIQREDAVKKASNKGKNVVYKNNDDVLATPAIFYAFNVGLSVWDDTKFGKIDPNPLERPVEFTHIAGVRMPRKANEKEDSIVNVSRATIRSKAEADWLRSHSKFNILFFERLPDVTSNIDYDEIRDKTDAGNTVDRMSAEEIIMKYRQLNSGKTLSNIADMRVFVYQYYVDSNKKYRTEAKKNAVQTYIDALPEDHADKNAKVVNVL